MNQVPFGHSLLRLCWLGYVLAGSTLVLTSCDDSNRGKSVLFYEVFRDDSTTFRGVELGDPIQQVVYAEQGIDPIHQDQMGVSYRVLLNPGYEMWVDYHSDYLIAPSPKEALAAIDVNIFIGDEVETAKLFREIGQHYDQRYGIHRVAESDYIWEGASGNETAMEIMLRLNENKVALTLNYIDIEPDRQLKSLGEFNFDSLKNAAESAHLSP